MTLRRRGRARPASTLLGVPGTGRGAGRPWRAFRRCRAPRVHGSRVALSGRLRPPRRPRSPPAAGGHRAALGLQGTTWVWRWGTLCTQSPVVQGRGTSPRRRARLPRPAPAAGAGADVGGRGARQLSRILWWSAGHQAACARDDAAARRGTPRAGLVVERRGVGSRRRGSGGRREAGRAWGTRRRDQAAPTGGARGVHRVGAVNSSPLRPRGAYRHVPMRCRHPSARAGTTRRLQRSPSEGCDHITPQPY